jgi:hypothetical protein
MEDGFTEYRLQNTIYLSRYVARTVNENEFENERPRARERSAIPEKPYTRFN